MEYPAWYVPFLTAPMLIPLLAIPHVIVAEFAVGGGFLLVDLLRRAYRENNVEVLGYLRGLTRFFVLITLVFGAVSGVGIWWTIGLTSPETTSALMRIFVFGWAAEWVAFLLEIVSAFAFYYLWDRLKPREHLAMGWIYAGSAWVSLVLITGITAFMSTTGNWTPGKGFWTAFFNPSFLPQVILRTGGSLSIAALGIGFHLSLQSGSEGWRDLVIRSISRWALVGMAFILLSGLWYLGGLPDLAKLNMMRSPMLLIMTTLNFSLTLVVIVALALGSAAGSRWITPPSAILLLLAGMTAITTGEFIREGARKPYRIEKYLLGPGVRVHDLPALRRDGLIAHSPWLKHYLTNKIPADALAHLAPLTPDQKAKVGEAIFRYHCASCHALFGYNGIRPLIRPWTPKLIRDAVQNLHRTSPAMPPWLGNENEREALTAYLIELREKETKP